MKWAKSIRSAIRSLLPRSRYLYRIIWFGCIAVSIPVLLTASAYYQYSMNTLKARFIEDSQASVLLLKDRMESAFMDIEYESLQLAVNPELRGPLSNAGFADDVVAQQRILDFLLVHKNSSDLIEEIIWYASASGLVLSNAYGAAPLERFPQRAEVERALALEKHTTWTYLSSPGGRVVSFVRKLPIMSVGDPQGALIVHVNRESLTRLMESHFLSLRGQTLAVLDGDSRALLHSGDSGLSGRSVKGDPAFELIVRVDASFGTLTTKDGDGEPQLTVFQTSSFGRTYVSFLPEAEIISELAWIRVFAVYSLAVTLAVGIALTLITSRMAYSPIDQLIKYGEGLRREGKGAGLRGNEIEFIRSSLAYLNEQAEQLNNYVRQTNPDLRDRFLLRLVKGASGKRETIAETCRKFDIPTDRAVVALVAKVENLFKEKRFLPHEGAVIVFAVRNVMLELLESSSDIYGYVIEKDEREVVAILFDADGAGRDALVAGAKRYAERSRQALLEYLSFSVSVGIGGAKEDAANIAESYAEANHALQYRLFHDTEPVLYYEDTLGGAKRQPAFHYPKAVEEDILSALTAGDAAQASKGLNQFYERVRASESFNAMLQSYQVLLSSIIRSLEEKGPGVMELTGGNWFEQLKARQTYSEVHEWFVDTLFPSYLGIAEELRSNSAKMAIHLVCRHIRNDPGAPHTLTDCAERVGLSPSYLSRMFKQEMGVSFIEYVTEHKVEEAKRLLSETDRSVTDIAEAVGYSERNLTRAFQRHVGMSPKQYRISLR